MLAGGWARGKGERRPAGRGSGIQLGEGDERYQPTSKNLHAQHQETPLEEGLATHSSISPGETHGQKSLAGYSPLHHKELD